MTTISVETLTNINAGGSWQDSTFTWSSTLTWAEITDVAALTQI
jgi:hypothetical protein